jgi:hypothetical protein
MEWVYDSVIIPLSDMTLIDLSITLMVGLLGGVFPIPGATTPATALLAKWHSFHPARLGVATGINLILTPVQLLLIPTFAQLGSKLTRMDASTFTASHIAASMNGGLGNFFRQAAAIILNAVIGWCLLLTLAVAVEQFILS